MSTAATAAASRSASEDSEAPRPSPLHLDYFTRILPDPPVVCGRQLLPLSIGRYRLLHRFHCAFVEDGPATASAGDLLTGVTICSLRVDEFMAFAASPDFQKQLDRWASTFNLLPPRIFSWPVIGRWLAKWFGETTDAVDLANLLPEIAKFKDYIAESQTVPPYWDEQTDQRPPSSRHWSQSIEAALREFQGWTLEEINEAPLAKALWDYFAHCENRGIIRLMTPDEIAELEKPEDPAETAAWEEYARALERAKSAQTQS